MVKIGLKWSKMVKMVKNGGPDLKRAQRTGLSARRARRTKSRGLKSLQLEVGARRAPRLLVKYIFTKICKDALSLLCYPYFGGSDNYRRKKHILLSMLAILIIIIPINIKLQFWLS